MNYGFGESGSNEDPVFGFGESGSNEDPVFGFGESGSKDEPVFGFGESGSKEEPVFEDGLLAANEMAIFVAATRNIATRIVTRRFTLRFVAVDLDITYSLIIIKLNEVLFSY